MTEAFKKFDLTGKTAFVTGGGTGLGYYMARGLARSGAKVMIAARREAVLQEAVEKLTAESDGNKVLYGQIDLADRSNIVQAAEQAITTLGGIDIFIGNAALDVFGPLDDISDDQVSQVFQVNVSANITLSRLFLPHMRDKKWGRIIYSSSVASQLSSAVEGTSAYGASKSAVNSLAHSIATEAGHDGITVNALILGSYYTSMMQEYVGSLAPEPRHQFISALSSINALGRLGRSEEVEGIVQLLASDAGSFITGSDIAVDGGWAITMRPNIPKAP